MPHVLIDARRVRRWVALTGAVILTSAVLVAGPSAQRATAIDFYVQDEQDFVDAIDNAEATPGDHRIIFENDIEFSDDLTREFTAPSNTLEIDGAGFTAACLSDEPCDNFFVAFLAGGVELRDLTIEGFIESAVVVIETPVLVDGVTFQYNARNNTDAPADSAYGGALLILGSDIFNDPAEIINSRFVGNSVGSGTGEAQGGAIYIQGDATIYNTEFIDNLAITTGGDSSALAAGGAIYFVDGGVEIEDAIFSGNQVQANNFESYGGAVGTSDGELYVYDSSFDSNSAGSRGGAIGISLAVPSYASGVYANGAVFTNNYAGFWGGAVYVGGASAELLYSEFTDNESGSAGGALVFDEAEVFVGASLLKGNYASVGGALSAINDTVVTVYASTLTENEAFGGSALWMSFSEAEFVHATIAGNQSTADGPMDDIPGGQLGAQYADLTLANSVIVDATDGGGNCGFFDVEVTSEGNNVGDDTTCGLGHASDVADTSVDPQLGPLKFNGGPTHTMIPAPGSMLIDAVTGQGCAAETEDQRGVMRPQGDACDIGAVETLVPITRSVVTPGGTVEFVIYNAVEGEGFPDVDNLSIASLSPAAPAGVSFPYGAFGLEIATYDDGWPVDVVASTPAPINQFWKLLNGSWSQYPATQDGNSWSFRLVDGADGDEDGDENSIIIDPVAFGAAAAFTG